MVESPGGDSSKEFTYCVACGLGVVPQFSFRCPICGRGPLCLKHRIEEQIWEEDELKVRIPACCNECFRKEMERAKPEMLKIEERKRINRKLGSSSAIGCAFFVFVLIALFYTALEGPYGGWFLAAVCAALLLSMLRYDLLSRKLKRHKEACKSAEPEDLD